MKDVDSKTKKEAYKEKKIVNQNTTGSIGSEIQMPKEEPGGFYMHGKYIPPYDPNKKIENPETFEKEDEKPVRLAAFE